MKKFCIILLLFLTGCFPYVLFPPPSKMVTDFFHMPASEQVQRFKDYSLEEQYELFLFSITVIHPPTSRLVRPFAEQGPIIVPLLKTKLENEQDEWTNSYIFQVFSELARLKLYDFPGDPVLMELLDRKANLLSGYWKENALEIISEMWSMEL